MACCYRCVPFVEPNSWFGLNKLDYWSWIEPLQDYYFNEKQNPLLRQVVAAIAASPKVTVYDSWFLLLLLLLLFFVFVLCVCVCVCVYCVCGVEFGMLFCYKSEKILHFVASTDLSANFQGSLK